jgi:hypothetical protein
VNLIRDKEDLLEPMLEDPKLLERLFHDQETFMRISPHLLLSVLLRRVRKELENWFSRSLQILALSRLLRKGIFHLMDRR